MKRKRLRRLSIISAIAVMAALSNLPAAIETERVEVKR